MKTCIIAANFKSNKTRQQMQEWMDVFDSEFTKTTLSEKHVILVPSLPSMMFVSNRLLSYPRESFSLGVQDISPFSAGAYTGAISGETLEGFHVSFAIVGHSERRKQFHETDDEIAQKCLRAREAGITPLLCVQGNDTPIPSTVTIVAYEPVFAIGSGHPDTPDDANTVANDIKDTQLGVKTVLYGGSVTSENVRSFTSQEHIDGVLVGKASLDPHEFVKLIKNA